MKLEPVLAQVTYPGLWRHDSWWHSGCQGAVRGAPDRSSLIEAALTQETAGRYQLPVQNATGGFQPRFWEAKELHSMWSGTPAASQCQVLAQG